ncbi:hypothetical protein SAY87_019425 [Trapa incisa]|uniref:3-beta-hydroxysteroid-Delta(8),Delta(7)-isomerase n=1 Tax=Trapa incisa TaxID=236973 RepID=A0AAN7K2A3_9MYRT|nr:hypothetical protein SAY87_019425 [Trapa incisa]
MFLLVEFLVAGRSPRKSGVDRLLMCWWAFTGLTHMILEGYFVFSPDFYKNPSGFYLAEVCKLSSLTFSSSFIIFAAQIFTFLWGCCVRQMAGKEYSKGDSRYAGRDSAIVSVEGLTAVIEGPASLLAV